MGYKKIYFSGVDLYDGRYFWTDDPKYKDIVPPILNSCKPDERSKDDVHSTQDRNIAEWIGEFLKINNIEAINLAEKSLLSKYIRTEK